MPVSNAYNMGLNHRNESRGGIAQIAFPNPDNSYAALLKILILGFVQIVSFGLPGIKFFKFSRVTMPIVSVELDNGFSGRNISIYTELVKQKFLRLKINIGISQYLITDFFNRGRFFSLLGDIHFNQFSLYRLVFISTFNRTESRIVKLESAGRKLISISACIASVGNFFTLPLRLAFCGTGNTLINSAVRDVKHNVANDAIKIFPSFLSSRFPVLMVTFGSAVLDVFCTAFSYGFTATNANVCANTIFHRNKVTKYLLTHTIAEPLFDQPKTEQGKLL